jgi:hypothetical protein
MTYNATRTTASPGNLNTNAFVRAADGNFMLRAQGVPVPEPVGLAAIALIVVMGLRRPGRCGACRSF